MAEGSASVETAVKPEVFKGRPETGSGDRAKLEFGKLAPAMRRAIADAEARGDHGAAERIRANLERLENNPQ